jgi:hypothetical protein
MAKSIEQALARLLGEEKDYSFAVLYLADKSPMLVEPQVKFTRASDDPDFVTMTYFGPAPFPQQKEVPDTFEINSYFRISEIRSLEFYTKQLIKTSPHGVLSKVD